MIQGTPKTLAQAIANALDAAEIPSGSGKRAVIAAHLVDFLAQRFGAALLESPEAEAAIQKLWKQINEKS